ncbi:MAG: hypothetical protein GY946_06485 [bacterium]|nr:hypothetical protein [bacterium]
MTQPEVRFREEQRFRQWWLWVPLMIAVGVVWWGFLHQVVGGEPWGNRPAPDGLLWGLWIGVGVVMPILFWLLRLVTEIDDQQVRVSFRPLPWHVKTPARIESHEAVTFRPIRHYGGWGWRYGASRGWCFTVRGTRGVYLEIHGARNLLIGSQRAEELDRAIGQLRTGGTPPEEAGLRMGRPLR